MKRLALFILVLIKVSLSIAQEGTIKGTVFDGETNETLPFANIYLENDKSIGTTSDIDGNYKLILAPGTYTVVFSFTSFEPIKEEITVGANQVIEKVIKLGVANDVLEAFEVVVEKKEANSVKALDMEKAKSSSMIDGTSAEQMQKTGDNDAGEVMKRVTGVSVEEGKHVYVRGLGDRYAKTILNSMTIPGLDPDRNSVQMDIFPTALIDNIIVYKTFTPDLQGEFAGGIVDVHTKDFPSAKYMKVKAGFGYNTNATFNSNYIGYKGGKLDFLGFDDGTRSMPIRATDVFPDPTQTDQQTTDLTKQFSQTMAATPQSNFLNQNYLFAKGNNFKFDSSDVEYGYNFVVNYRNNYNYYKNVEFNEYQLAPDSSENELQRFRSSSGQMGGHEITWSTLFSNAIKLNKYNKISLTMFHTQNAISSSAILSERDFEDNPATLAKNSLQYTQRSVSNVLIAGKHEKDNWKLKWKIAPTYSRIKDPDIRSTIFEEVKDSDGEAHYYLSQGVGAEISRIFRDLSEINLSERVDLEYTFNQWNELESKLKFGMMDTYKSRDYSVFNYIFLLENVYELNADPNQLFVEENIWTPETDQGIYGKGERELANTYSAQQNIFGAYAMNELPISKKFKTVYGLRVEKADNFYTGQSSDASRVYNNQKVLDELDLMPAVSFTYAIRDTIGKTMNLRGSFAQTVARPSFKEKSIAQIYDPIQGRRYNGNIDLLETHIQNFDLRWEYFFGRTETVSVSSFYKTFQNPIEIVSFEKNPNEIQPVNAGYADMVGAEFEFRKRIGFTEKDWNKFTVGSNLTLVQSRIDMKQVIVDDAGQSEYDVRVKNARAGETISQYRPMYGQSPYVLNAFIGFAQDSLGLEFNLSYNVQGKRLAVIGYGSLSNVYEQPFHSLNAKVTKKFGNENHWKASLTARNLLGFAKRKFYESYGAESQIYSYFYGGRRVSLSVSYSF